MSEESCNFCRSAFWLEHIKICKNCFERFHSIHGADFMIYCKKPLLQWMTTEEFYDEELMDVILNNFGEKIKKRIKELEEKNGKV